jgi:2-polyprenyl-3-methyl-5-hydroxy-6-metoxy-1,4-benzoquinol methylase
LFIKVHHVEFMNYNTKALDFNSGIRCVLCGSSGRIIFSNLSDMQYNIPGKWSLSKCDHCGLVWQHPLPEPEQIHRFYADYHTHEESVEDSLMAGVFYRGIPVATMGYEKKLASRSERLLGAFFSLIGPLKELGQGAIFWLDAKSRGKLLDVGCGSGVFLRRWQNLGWDVNGLEMDPEAVKTARQVIQSDNVFHGTIDDLATNERYDVITLIHVIEHLLDPVATLKKCHDLLKPGGSIIISTPNSSGLGARILKKNWRGWEPPRHIFLYNPKTLPEIVQKAGFTVESVLTPSNATLLIWSFSLKIRRKILKKMELNFISRIAISIQSILFWILEYILTRFGIKFGEVVHLVAVKDK